MQSWCWLRCAGSALFTAGWGCHCAVFSLWWPLLFHIIPSYEASQLSVTVLQSRLHLTHLQGCTVSPFLLCDPMSQACLVSQMCSCGQLYLACLSLLRLHVKGSLIWKHTLQLLPTCDAHTHFPKTPLHIICITIYMNLFRRGKPQSSAPVIHNLF